MALSLNKLFFDEEAIAISSTSEWIDVEDLTSIDIVANVVDGNPDNESFVSGVLEVQTMTFESKANADQGDYIVFRDTNGIDWACGMNKGNVYEVQTLTFPSKDGATNADYVVVENPAATKWAVYLDKNSVLAVQTLTFSTKAASGGSDYVVLSDTSANTWAIYLEKGNVYPVQTLTFPSLAASTDGDYVAFYDAAGLRWAAALDKTGLAANTPSGAIWSGVPAGRKAYVDVSAATTGTQVASAISTAMNLLTGFTAAFGNVLNSADFVLTGVAYTSLTAAPVPKNKDDSGAGSITAALTTQGGPTGGPTGAEWATVSASRRGSATITSDTTAAQVAARVETAFNALTGFTALFTSNDNAADGTMTMAQTLYGPVTVTHVHNYNDLTVGSIAGVSTTTGVVQTPPTGAIWTAVSSGNKGACRITDLTTAAQVAAQAEVAFNALTGFTAAITTDDTAGSGSMSFTSVAYGNAASPVPKNSNDGNAGTIAIAGITEGNVATAISGEAWSAIAAGRKAFVDISSATTAAQVAALVETAIDALTGLSDVITTDDSAANGTMTFTSVVRGPVTDPTPHNINDSGAGGITGVQTTAGVTSDVNITNNTVYNLGHGFITGEKVTLTTSSSLPTGLATSTDYYTIRVDDDYIKFATSQANALAGTAIDITGYGVGTQTVVVDTDITGTIQLQRNIQPDNTTQVWCNILEDDNTTSSTKSFSAAGVLGWRYTGLAFRQIRAIATVTSGEIVLSMRICGKNN